MSKPYRCPGCERMHRIHECFKGCGDHWPDSAPKSRAVHQQKETNDR